MANLLKKLFKSPQEVAKMTAKEYYTLFKKVFAKVNPNEQPETEEEVVDNEDIVPSGEPFFYVLDFDFLDGAMPLVWVGNVNVEWKNYRKSMKMKSTFAQGYAEQVGGEQVDEEGKDFVFTITDGKAFKDSACRMVEKTIQKFCTKKVNVTLPKSTEVVKEEEVKPKKQPKKQSVKFDEIMAMYQLYKGIDGQKASSAKIKSRLMLEELLQSWTAKDGNSEQNDLVKKLISGMDTTVQWQEQLQDLAADFQRANVSWNNWVKKANPNFQDLANWGQSLNPKDMRSHYLEVRTTLSELIDWQVKLRYYFADEIKAKSLPQTFMTKVEEMSLKLKSIENQCQKVLTALTENNPNASRLEQAYKDISPKDDINIGRLNVMPGNLENCPKDLRKTLEKFSDKLGKLGKNVNLAANELQADLLELSDYLTRKSGNIPPELRKEIGDKVYEARKEIGLSGQLDNDFLAIVRLSEGFAVRKEKYLLDWGNKTALEQQKFTKEQIAESQAARSNIRGIIRNIEAKIVLWEEANAERFGLVEVQTQSKTIRKIRRDMADLSQIEPRFRYTLPNTEVLKKYVLSADKEYKADAVAKYKTDAKIFMATAVNTHKSMSLDSISAFFKKKKPDNTAKITIVESRIKSIHSKLEKITKWQVDAKFFEPNEDLKKAKAHFDEFVQVLQQELAELNATKQIIYISDNSEANQKKITRISESSSKLDLELQKLMQKEVNGKASDRELKKIAHMQKKRGIQETRKYYLQNKVVQAQRALEQQAKAYISFDKTELDKLREIAVRWEKANTPELKLKFEQEAQLILSAKGKFAKSPDELNNMIVGEDYKALTYEATSEKAKKIATDADETLKQQYENLAQELTKIVAKYDENAKEATLKALAQFSNKVTLLLPDSQTINDTSSYLGLTHYPNMQNLRWHAQRLQKEISEAETVDKKIAKAILKDAGLVVNMREDDPDFVRQATAMLTAIQNWQNRNTPPKDDKGVWTLPSNKNLHGSFDVFKDELVEKLKRVEALKNIKPSYPAAFDSTRNSIKSLTASMKELEGHPQVKKWLAQLQTLANKFDDGTLTIMTPNLVAELDKIEIELKAIRRAYVVVEADVCKTQEERTFAAFKGDFDIYKNKGMVVPDKEVPNLQKTYERIINRVNNMILAGEPTNVIYQSLAHIPFNFIPNKCIADLAAWDKTRKAVLEKHFSAERKNTHAEQISSVKFQELPIESIQKVEQQARDFMQLEDTKKLVTDLADKTPEELDKFLQDLALTKKKKEGDSVGEIALDITSIVAQTVQKLVQASGYAGKGVGIIDDKTQNNISDSIALSRGATGSKVVNDATTVGTILGGVSSILTAVVQTISLFKIEPSRSPQKTFDQIMRKSMTALEALANLGIGITYILDALQFAVEEVLIGFNLAMDLINLSKAVYDFIQHLRMAIKTDELQQAAKIEDNPLAMAFQQELDGLDRKMALDSLLIATSTTAAIGSTTQLAGLADPTGSTLLAGKIIRWTAKGVEVAGKIVLEAINVAEIIQSRKFIQRAAAGDREAALLVMSSSAYYAKMYIALCAYEGDPLAKKYLIDRNLASEDLENEFTSKSVLQEALLKYSNETDDTNWYDPVSGDFTPFGIKSFGDLLDTIHEKFISFETQAKLFFNKVPVQNYETLQKMGLCSLSGLHTTLQNYIKFKSKKLNPLLHPHRHRLANSYAGELKTFYKILQPYEQTLRKNIQDAIKDATTIDLLNQATKVIALLEEEVNEVAHLMKLCELHELV